MACRCASVGRWYGSAKIYYSQLRVTVQIVCRIVVWKKGELQVSCSELCPLRTLWLDLSYSNPQFLFDFSYSSPVLINVCWRFFYVTVIIIFSNKSYAYFHHPSLDDLNNAFSIVMSFHVCLNITIVKWAAINHQRFIFWKPLIYHDRNGFVYKWKLLYYRF